jgi:amino acid transporter
VADKAPRLARGVLGLFDIASSTMANIAPAMSFYFGFGLIAATAGVASPLTLVVAAVAIALLGNTLSEFSRSIPSTGSFITFIGKTFGPVAGITTAIVASAGYIIAVASVVDIAGGWLAIILDRYLHVHIAWQILTLLLAALVFYLNVAGVKLSTKWAAFFFFFEMAVLYLVGIAVLVANPRHISLAPFDPGHLLGGLRGLGLGFPLAVYLFIGWENSASLAEETEDPRRNVPKAIYASLLLMAVSYLFFGYATVVGFHENVKALTAAAVPYITAAGAVSPVVAVLAYLAGFTSTMGALISATNSQARLIFNAAREGLLPRWAAQVTARTRTPWAAILIYLFFALALTYVFGWEVPPTTFFGIIATLGTILVVVTYLVANLALPFYYRRFHPDTFSAVRHVLLPILGVVAIAYPLWGLVQPGQPSPFNLFPWISLAIIVLALIYALVLNAREPGLADRIGSLIADRHD